MQWRAYSPKAAAECELCNCSYTLPGPLGCGQTSALTLTLVALLMIWMSLARDVLVVNGSLLPAAKHCNVGEFTPPWRRALVSLFEAADLDQDGAMSLEEMRALANRTGEKVSDAVLELALKLADHNENLGFSSSEFFRSQSKVEPMTCFLDYANPANTLRNKATPEAPNRKPLNP